MRETFRTSTRKLALTAGGLLCIAGLLATHLTRTDPPLKTAEVVVVGMFAGLLAIVATAALVRPRREFTVTDERLEPPGRHPIPWSAITSTRAARHGRARIELGLEVAYRTDEGKTKTIIAPRTLEDYGRLRDLIRRLATQATHE